MMDPHDGLLQGDVLQGSALLDHLDGTLKALALALLNDLAELPRASDSRVLLSAIGPVVLRRALRGLPVGLVVDVTLHPDEVLLTQALHVELQVGVLGLVTPLDLTHHVLRLLITNEALEPALSVPVLILKLQGPTPVACSTGHVSFFFEATAKSSRQ